MEEWTTIRYLHAQGKSIRTIASELSVARQTVRRALEDESKPRYKRPPRPNPKLEPYEAQVRELYFGKHLNGSRIFRELQQLGYRGGSSALYTYLRRVRQAKPSGKTTMRFETEPGVQAQFDWSPYTVEIGGELRRLVVYGMIMWNQASSSSSSSPLVVVNAESATKGKRPLSSLGVGPAGVGVSARRSIRCSTAAVPSSTAARSSSVRGISASMRCRLPLASSNCALLESLGR